MVSDVPILTLCAESSPFCEYDPKVRLWAQVTNLGPAKRAFALILHKDTVARQVCLHAGGDTLMDGGRAGCTPNILR